MQYDKIAKSYKAQSVQTASPGKLVLMLFDGYLRFSAAAKQSFDLEILLRKMRELITTLLGHKILSRNFSHLSICQFLVNYLVHYTVYTIMFCTTFSRQT